MPPRKKASIVPTSSKGIEGLLGELRGLIQQSRLQLLRAVDVVQVRTFWEVGRHIVEFEQGGAKKAQYGTGLLERLAAVTKKRRG